jgi:hypothetical protein
MGYEMDIQEKEKYILLSAKGERTKEDIVEICKKLMEKCVETGKPSVLIDLRGSSSDLSIMETFFLADSELPEFLHGKIKVVAIIEDEINEKMKFFEDVCINRGHLVKFFEGYEEAEKWLVGNI